jgi:isopentenyl-diphosphate delta-isomerase type 1
VRPLAHEDHVGHTNAVPAADDPNEVFDLVDGEDRVIGQVRRAEAHHDPSLLHRSVQVLILADDGRVLLQRRSQRKDLFPGYFCASASGHVASGDDYLTTAQRELQEELGIQMPLRFIGTVLVRSEYETEMTAIFAGRSNGPFHFNALETDGGEYFTRGDLAVAERRRLLPLTPALIASLDALGRLVHDGGVRTLLDTL